MHNSFLSFTEKHMIEPGSMPTLWKASIIKIPKIRLQKALHAASHLPNH